MTARCGASRNPAPGAGRAGATRSAAASYAVATLFTASGCVHLLRPAVFLPLVPGWLPLRTEAVTVSGLAELACAAGLLTRRSWAGRASALLLLVVWVGNVQMAMHAGSENGAIRPWVAWARVPLQVPPIWAALQAPRTAR